MLVDMRSVDMRCLADLERSVLAIVGGQAKGGPGHAGPCGGPACRSDSCEPSAGSDLHAIYRAFGITTSSKAASTEATAPLSMGIPAVCLSVTSHENGHPADEFFGTAPLASGINARLLLPLTLTGRR